MLFVKSIEILAGSKLFFNEMIVIYLIDITAVYIDLEADRDRSRYVSSLPNQVTFKKPTSRIPDEYLM
jgi:hypothetical protein